MKFKNNMRIVASSSFIKTKIVNLSEFSHSNEADMMQW